MNNPHFTSRFCEVELGLKLTSNNLSMNLCRKWNFCSYFLNPFWDLLYVHWSCTLNSGNCLQDGDQSHAHFCVAEWRNSCGENCWCKSRWNKEKDWWFCSVKSLLQIWVNKAHGEQCSLSYESFLCMVLYSK